MTQFVIDSLMKLGMDIDDHFAQKSAIARLCDFAMAKQGHIHLVVHSRKPSNAFEGLPGKYDIKGAGDISDQAYNVLNVWRNKKKERVMAGEVEGEDKREWRDAADAKLICDKQRHFEWEGSVSLWFNRKSYQVADVYETLQDLMAFGQ